MRKEAYLNTRLTRAELGAIERDAQIAGARRSEFIREALMVGAAVVVARRIGEREASGRPEDTG